MNRARPSRVPPITAAHGSEISVLAVAPDGAAVISADRVGGLRLWTAFDGTREPVVIHGTAPRSLAVIRDGDGFAIGLVDAAGGVHVVRVTGAGAPRGGELGVAADQPASELDAVTGGFLVLRADQTIERIAATGAVAARLRPEPGSHVEAIVTRGDRALALVREGKQVHGRWLALEPGASGAAGTAGTISTSGAGLAWGEATPPIDGAIVQAVLSPDGTRLVVTRPRGLHPALIDLATGHATKTAVCVTRGWPRDSGMELDDASLLADHNAPLPLGFLRDGVIACSVMNALVWWRTDGAGAAIETRTGTLSVGGVPFAISDRALIVAAGASLSIGTTTEHKYLGYGFHDVAHLRTGPGGVLIDSFDLQAFLLDGALAEHTRFEPARSRIDWTDAMPIDDRYVLLASLHPVAGRTPDDVVVGVFDGVAGALRQALPYRGHAQELSYEPTTRLLATADDLVSLLVRLDPATHTFGAPTRIANAITTGQLRVVDPAQTGGVAALEIDATNGGLLVGEIYDADIHPGGIVQPRTTYRIPGELRAVDRAGRVYVREHDAKDVTVYTRGVAGATLAGVGGFALRPSADGARIAAFDAPHLKLLASSGAEQWEVAHWGGGDPGWTPGGELVMQFATGVAQLDLATGALGARRCGWSFGASEQPIEAARANPTICDVAER